MSAVSEILRNSPLASREWRLSNIYTIRDADGALVKFRPNESQRDFYNDFWYCNDVLKARKLGLSTFIEMLELDSMLFSADGTKCGIIDYTIEDAEVKIGMIKTAWEHLSNGDIHPDTWEIGKAIQRAVPMSAAARTITFGNGSVVRASTSLRGDTPNFVHISEMGKTAVWAPIKAREIVNGAFNSMTPGNIRCMESTHEGGKIGEHYRLLSLSMRADRLNLSPVQSRFHFFPWWRDGRYRIEPRGFTLRPEVEGYFQRLRESAGIVCDISQMLWYDHKHMEQGHGMKKEFPSTAGEAFEAIQEGAIYGTEMADLRAAGRICDFNAEMTPPVFTFWDIGLSDYSAVWLIQPVGRWFLVLDWFEAEGLPAPLMARQMARWESKWRRPMSAHFLPHDADTRAPGTGRSYVTELVSAGMQNIRVVPRTPDKWLGIGHTRAVLPHCWFHKTHCDTSRNRDGTPHSPGDTMNEEFPSGIACLEGYSKDVGAAAQKHLREMPRHDIFSHSADAFRTFGEAHHRNLITAHLDPAPATGPRATGHPRR